MLKFRHWYSSLEKQLISVHAPADFRADFRADLLLLPVEVIHVVLSWSDFDQVMQFRDQQQLGSRFGQR